MKSLHVLKKVPLFHQMTKNDLSKLAKIAKTEEVKKNEIIFSKATWGDALYVVVSGVVKIYSVSRTGKTKTFDYLEAGDFFGEMALLEKTVHSASAVAITPVEVLVIRRKNFQNLLRVHPDVSLLLLKTLSARLRKADSEIESLSFNSVLGRLAKILLHLAKQHGKKRSSGIRLGLELSHQELAEMAGTAREMVSRVLSRFVRLGCICVDDKYITITNPAMLRNWVF